MRKRLDTPEAELLDKLEHPDNSRKASSVRPRAGSYRGRVLVIDDTREARHFIATVLAVHGFDVLQAAGGEEGLTFYRGLHAAIDAVVLDMQMPGMDGPATFRELKRVNPSVRVILCSGGFPALHVDDDVRSQVLACLPKPFRPEELIETLDAALAEEWAAARSRRDG